jgi:uncharacterized protein with HEPN domain
MERDPKKYLFDILEAGNLIKQFTHGKSADQYQSDPMLRSAVERQFQIIGEALQQLLKEHPHLATKISDYRNIIDFRHILVHGYDRVEDDVVWGIIESKLSILCDEIESLLKTRR